MSTSELERSTVEAPVPFVDLRPQHAAIDAEVRAAIAEVLDSGAYVLGPQVRAFEEAYARFCGVGHCAGVGNGTDAIELALRAAGVGPGDEVVMPANTFVATAEAVLRAGAELVLADCGEDLLIDPARAAERVTARTRAVVGVDLHGQVADFEALAAAVGPGVLLVEDAAQSQGATRNGRSAGSFGRVAATAFYPGKNLGAFGDAGAVTTDDADVAARVRALRNHGGEIRYQHELVGTNSRLDSIQAAVLSVKLGRLRGWNAERQAAAARYADLLAGIDGLALPGVLPGNEHVWHVYVVRVRERDRVAQALGDAGIGTGVHYPTPVHLMPAFAHRGEGVGTYPVAERAASEILSLPMYPGLAADQQQRVADVLRRALA